MGNEAVGNVVASATKYRKVYPVTTTAPQLDIRRAQDRPRTQIAWLEYAPEIAAFYDKMSAVVQHLNQNFYKFDITGLENFQYTVYHADQRGHYDWHIDFGAKNPRPRKISISLQLSDGDAYEGCDLQFQPGNKIGTAPRKRGTLVAFPSFFLHRVTPITAGTRKSLVCWVAGPAFR